MFEINENNEVVRERLTRAVLAGISLDDEDISSSMYELKGLAEAAGAEVLGEIVQVRQRPDKATYIGNG